jgi:beta-galactosidase
VAYKDGEKWAEDVVKTTGDASALQASVDRDTINAEGKDLAFITVQVTDNEELMVPGADNVITFTIEGPGEIVATDNGVRSKPGETGVITPTATYAGLEQARVVIESQ